MKKLFPPLLLAMIAMAYWWIDAYRSKQSSCTQDVLVQKEAESIPPFDVVAGRWISDFGTLKFWSNRQADEVSGVYINTKTGQMDGLINATLDGNILTGYWIQQNSQRRCGKQKFETFFWGRLEFSFDSEDLFSGQWGYCDEMVQREWNGSKLRRR
jgi:hypothetical protein|tara:strand:+ start:313 stop:780 length:468 start_codon:yes stop_codon:yes gene_type:complete